MTSAQAIDVLRAWTDAAFERVVCAIAAAVLLGAVVRDSCASFLKQAQATTDALPDPPARAAVPPQAAAAPTTLPAQWWTRAASWLWKVARAAPWAVTVGLLQVLWTALRALGRSRRGGDRSLDPAAVRDAVILRDAVGCRRRGADIVSHWTLIFAVALGRGGRPGSSLGRPIPCRSGGILHSRPLAARRPWRVCASLRVSSRVAPLLTLFLGLVVATADSFLIRGASARGRFPAPGHHGAGRSRMRGAVRCTPALACPPRVRGDGRWPGGTSWPLRS